MSDNVNTNKTISELLFERFCSMLDIRFERIPCSDEKSPDYDIYPKGQRIVVEVKQIEPNKDDRQAERELLAGKVAIISTNPGERIRKKITDAAPQLSIRAKGICPSLLVLYNNVIPANYADPYSIKVAMYGYEQIVLAVPSDFSSSIVVRDKKFGLKRKMTSTHNTSISCVAVLFAEDKNPQRMDVYHNVHAAIPLPVDLLCGNLVRHFFLEERQPGQFQNWVEVQCET